MHFEAPPPFDLAAERAIVGASAVTSGFDRVATTAKGILAQVCTDQTVASKRIEVTINSMVTRGALERVEAGVVVRFEHLAYENRARIRAKQWQLQLEMGWPPNVATLARETQEPWLPLAAFPSRMQETLRHFLENGVVCSKASRGWPKAIISPATRQAAKGPSGP